jgi:hypothetical protein
MLLSLPALLLGARDPRHAASRQRLFDLELEVANTKMQACPCLELTCTNCRGKQAQPLPNSPTVHLPSP